ncbi:superoxide dismutase mitochondrial [Penicillium waksmanii]|uniref:superoxide dismutase mitochondrial n=1 Tax=Penicillium waksmanii TaxID=69791 RepID=UPI002547D69B|nr:superoxide dismutase mitochondrial [Penicillium waksmanii]KAJ5976293.1 superoxide dismutase mitochondrial [Penicillium waksmanii]
MAGKYKLPPLPYAYDALEPIISKEIMQIHHDKHHQAYVTNLNTALNSQNQALEDSNLRQLVLLQKKVKFNGGGHINHSLFWKNLAPPGSKETDIDTAAPTLKKAIVDQWGSVQKFKDEFNTVLADLQGSGWGWLANKQVEGRLKVISLKDQDPVEDAVPIFGVDMWEHAYYLQYKNDKPSYISNIWKVINWQEAENRFKNGVESMKF